MTDIFRNVSDQALQYKVNNIPGLLIFPDEFIWPDEAGNEPTTFNEAQSDWNGVNYQGAAFLALQAAGCVFLPAAGYRNADPDYINYAYVQDSDRNGNYWSATTSGNTDANCLSFNGSSINPTGVAGRYWAYAVRLVVDVTE